MTIQNPVEKFYTAFARRDAETMSAAYADHASFSDPVFPSLNAVEVRGMWRMLCSRAQDFRLEFVSKQLGPQHFRVEWQAWYTFAKTGRPVHNLVTADIRLEDGKILSHRDEFDVWRWSRQALGAAGWLLGWSPFLEAKVRDEASKALQLFLQQGSKRQK